MIRGVLCTLQVLSSLSPTSCKHIPIYTYSINTQQQQQQQQHINTCMDDGTDYEDVPT